MLLCQVNKSGLPIFMWFASEKCAHVTLLYSFFCTRHKKIIKFLVTLFLLSPLPICLWNVFPDCWWLFFVLSYRSDHTEAPLLHSSVVGLHRKVQGLSLFFRGIKLMSTLICIMNGFVSVDLILTVALKYQSERSLWRLN